MTAQTTLDPWIRRAKPREAASLRLFCLPYAGGGASIFNGWAEALPDAIDVCAVQLPGREERIAETPFRQVGDLLPVLLERLTPYLDRPFALFGHSMGAIVAYETARALVDQGRRPRHLIVSGQRAPHLPLPRPASYGLPDQDFRDRLRALNGTPEPVLRDPELMAMVLPLLRSDFELSETYRRAPADPLPCPISVLGGRNDEEVDRSGLEAWREVSDSDVGMKLFPGDHFYLHSQSGPLLETIRDVLSLNRTRRREEA